MAGYHLSNSDATHLPSSQNYITRPAQASVTPSRITADESAAPELDRAFEGLQVDPNGPYPYPTIYGADSKAKYWVPPRADAEKQYWNGEEGLILQEEASQRRSPRIWCLPKRTFTVVSVVVLVMICIAIGGGVGGYYANKRSTYVAQILFCLKPKEGMHFRRLLISSTGQHPFQTQMHGTAQTAEVFQ